MSRVIAVRQGPKRAVVLAGIRGPKGPVIADVEVDADGYLIVTLDDGTTVTSAAPVNRPWGTIIGDISAQTDLMQLLADLEDSIPTTPADIGAATAAQGALADTAVQPGDLSAVATSNDYGDLDNLPPLGTAAATNAADYATAAQGALADTAVQPADIADVVRDADTRMTDSRAPTGGAGGVLSGSYPNPGFAVDMATQAELDTAIATRIPTAARGAANGVASLGADGKIPESELPSIAITDTFTAASQAAMLALTAERGDIAIRTDLNKTFALAASPASTLANWLELRTPTDAVLSVAGKTGAVTLAKGDVGLGSVDNTSDAAKPVSTAQQAALDGKVGTTDARLTDAREWTADTVTQAEAEAGTATTRRAWTAQRVRQAILGWWNGVTSAFGRGFVAAADAAAGRTALGLGTAATRNVGTSSGNVLEVGAFGLGYAKRVMNFGERIDSGFYLGIGTSDGRPTGMVADGGWMINLNWAFNNAGNRYNCAFYGNVQNNFIGFRRINQLGEPQTPVEIYHTGNLTPNVLATFTLATLPSAAANPRLQVYCSNLAGQPAPVYSDGTNWRRVSDNTIAN